MRRHFSYWYICISLVLVISAFFVANVQLTASEWPISLVAILGFTAPVVVGAVQWLGRRRGLGVVAALGIYALIFETVAIKTGVPYGHFYYSGLLGPHVLGAAPLTVLVAWTPLVLGALALQRSLSPRKRVLLAIVLLVLTDVVLDPAAVHIGFWHWIHPGHYYGVPVINFIGWIISGTIAIVATSLYATRVKAPPMPQLLGYNLLGIIGFWSLVNLFAGQYVPALVGSLLIAAQARMYLPLKML